MVYVDSNTAYGRSVLKGILKYVNLQRRWDVRIDWSDASRKQSHFPACHGSIVAGVAADALRRIRESSEHLVSCSTAEARSPHVSVHVDNVLTGQLAAAHLHGCNLKHFACYPASGTGHASQRRFKAFAAVVEGLGYACTTAPTQWPRRDERLLQRHHPGVAGWIASLPKPVGILASDDVVGYDLAHCCKNAGISVPDEVAIIGVNNDELMCEGAWPPLSSVHVDYSRVGYRAAQLLERLLSGETLSEQEREVKLPPLGVVQRASTSVLAVSDPLLADAIRYMREHACDPCNVQDVLRHVPIARRTLEKLMSAELGRSPHQEILRTRIETAVRLLTESEFSITQIAERCGFSAVQNFNKAFRAQLDQTPARYRRAAQRGDRP